MSKAMIYHSARSAAPPNIESAWSSSNQRFELCEYTVELAVQKEAGDRRTTGILSGKLSGSTAAGGPRVAPLRKQGGVLGAYR
jgi:hypothetical protein